MRRLRQPARTATSLLRLAIRQVSVAPVLTGSILLALAPAGQALTLGDISIRSTLGQRLDATVPVRLGAGESLASNCVVAGQQGSDLRRVPGAQVTTPQAAREGVYELRVGSEAALYEPMYELELKVQCPGTPMLVRQYVLMLDLPGAVAAGVAEPAALIAPGSPAAVLPAAAGVITAPRAPAMRPRTATSRPTGTIGTGSRYRVAEGDTLSGIAARVQGRQVPLQAMADAIQAANPTAFIRNDANLIKLGSEILIPATTATDTTAASAVTGNSGAVPVPAAAPAGVPAPTIPPALDSVPQLPSPDVAPVVEAVLPAPAGTPAPAELTQTPSPAAAPAASDEPNPVVAAGAGIVFGLLISALLWFRGRLPARNRPAAAAARQKAAPASPEPAAVTTLPAPLVTRPVEPGFSVSFSPAGEDALAAEFADDREPEYVAAPAKAAHSAGTPAQAPSEDITSKLEELFDSTDTTIQKRLTAEKTVAARAFGGDFAGFAPDVDASGADVDFQVGDPTGEEALLQAATVEQPRPFLEATVQSPTVDLRTLATSATRDQQQAQTLLEALTLLERDYEEELTASQVLDMSAVRDALANDLDEPTQISANRLREAGARKKSR